MRQLKQFLAGLIRFFIGLPLLFSAVVTGGIAAACGAVAFCTMRSNAPVEDSRRAAPTAGGEAPKKTVSKTVSKPKKTVSKTVKAGA